MVIELRTVVFTELLLGYWTNEKLICICSPTLVLTKGKNAHQRNVSSARLIVYTAHFIRAGLDFQDLVPILSVLGLPLDMVRARVKFWSGTDGAKSFTRLNLSVPNEFFWYAYFFHPSRAKNFLPCKWGFCYNCLGNLVHPGTVVINVRENITPVSAKGNTHQEGLPQLPLLLRFPITLLKTRVNHQYHLFTLPFHLSQTPHLQPVSWSVVVKFHYWKQPYQ